MVRAWFARVPLGNPVASARIALAMDMEGEIIATGVWGNEDFDRDETGRWSLLLNSLSTSAIASLAAIVYLLFFKPR